MIFVKGRWLDLARPVTLFSPAQFSKHGRKLGKFILCFFCIIFKWILLSSLYIYPIIILAQKRFKVDTNHSIILWILNNC